jgi:hypothetical protein
MTALEFGKRRREDEQPTKAIAQKPLGESAEQADLALIGQLLKRDMALRDLLMEAYGIISLQPDAYDDVPLSNSFDEIKARIEEIQPGRGNKMDKETIRKFLASPKNGLA